MENETRAAWAYAALRQFADESGAIERIDDDEDCGDAIADLICDLAHYALQRGLNPVNLIERGAGMWSAEQRTPNGDPRANDIATLTIEHA